MPFGPLGGAATRAGELANLMGKTKNFVTIAVTETEEGVSVVSPPHETGVATPVAARTSMG